MVAGDAGWVAVHALAPALWCPDQSMPFPACSLHPSSPWRRPSPSGVSSKRQSVTISQSTGGAAQGNRLSLSTYHILTLIPSRGREEVHKPHPCTGELQVRRHQGGAYLLHHACGGRHALPAAPGTGSSMCSWTLSRSQPSEHRLLVLGPSLHSGWAGRGMAPFLWPLAWRFLCSWSWSANCLVYSSGLHWPLYRP